MPSIRDVAKEAGVGVATVSRALNNSGYVSEDAKKRIVEVAEKLGYKPSDLAKNLSRKRTGLIGVMVPNLEHPFFAKMMRCIELELSKHQYKCLVCNTIDINNRTQEFLEMLERDTVDGLISCVDPPYNYKGRGKKAIVAMDRKWGEDTPLIRSDHEMGGEIAANAFLEAGCKRIIQFSSGFGEHRSANIRHEVMEDILRKNGCDVVSVNMKWDAQSYGYNKNIIVQYLDQLKQCDGCMTNDIGAMSCISVCKKMGIRVPEDFKIIAYDGTEITNLSYPELSCVEQDCQGIAKACVETVLKIVEGDESFSMIQKIPVKWHKRGTT